MVMVIPTLAISKDLIPAMAKIIALGADDTGRTNPCEQTNVGGTKRSTGLMTSLVANFNTIGMMMAAVVTLETI